jgi:predicted transposase YbfD/YdcC
LPKKTFDAAAKANAHLIVQLKDNQPTLCVQALALSKQGVVVSRAETLDDRARNRHETRVITVFDPATALFDAVWKTAIAAVIRVERTVLTFNLFTQSWTTAYEASFYLSNRTLEALSAAASIRAHWGIENKVHYVRDVTFHEDASRIRRNPGVFARLRSFAYNILRLNQRRTMPQDRYAAALGGIHSLLSMAF